MESKQASTVTESNKKKDDNDKKVQRSDGAVGKAFASNCKVAGSSAFPGSNSNGIVP